MEFASEEEAKEWAEEHGYDFCAEEEGEELEFGTFLVKKHVEPASGDYTPKTLIKNTLLWTTLPSGSKMYWGKNNKATFRRADALVMTASAANTRKYYLEKNGVHIWHTDNAN